MSLDVLNIENAITKRWSEQLSGARNEFDFKISIPASAYKTPGLTWSRSATQDGNLIYVADLNVETTGCFQIISSVEPVQFFNEKRAAFIFKCDDRQTHEFFADIILNELKFMPSTQGIFKEVIIHPLCNDVLVVTFPWVYRDLVANAQLEKAMHLQTYNQEYQSLIRRALLCKARSAYDVASLQEFNRHCTRLNRRKFQSDAFTSRFSDFSCKTSFNFATGVVFELEFDLKRMANFANSVIRQYHNNYITSNKPDPYSFAALVKEILFNHSADAGLFNGFSEGSQPKIHNGGSIITLNCKVNNKASTDAMSDVISNICGITNINEN